MPSLNRRPEVLSPKLTGKNVTAGKIRVKYISANKKTMDAVVLSAGTAAGLKLRVPHLFGSRIIDNVPQSAGHGSTNCYTSRT